MGSRKAVASAVPLPHTLARALAGNESLAGLAARNIPVDVVFEQGKQILGLR